MSAHRDPEMVREYCTNARMRGLKVIIAGAGMSAALPGVAAAHTDLPVIGVPILGKSLGGLDALLSAVQMPPGIPVACVAIDGAKNAGMLAARIINADDRLALHPRRRSGRSGRRSAKMEAWLEVELAATEAWAEEGVVPREAAEAARAKAAFTVEAVDERERVTDHDVAAFVDVVAASVGEHGRWIHYGLTSSDVLDTALALQLREAGEIVVAGARAYRDALIERALEHRDTLCVGRTHGVHAEPTTFGLRLAGFAFEADRNLTRLERRLRAARLRQALRRGRDLRLGPARGRGAGDGAARAAAARTSPPRSIPRDRHAVLTSRDRDRRRRAGALRDRGPQPAAHRGARGRGALRRRPEGLLGDAAQAQPDPHRADHRARPGAARLRPGRARERRPLARARHLPLRRRAGDPARRDDPARLHAGPGDQGRRRDDRPRRAHAGEPRASPTAPSSASAP